jgi:transcriptional regulator of acetoin/glycerol metabolism
VCRGLTTNADSPSSSGRRRAVGCPTRSGHRRSVITAPPARSRCSRVAVSSDLRFDLLHRLDLGLDLDAVADHYAAGLEDLAEVERDYVAAALRASGGNRAKAAEKLGIGAATLYRKLKQARS